MVLCLFPANFQKCDKSELIYSRSERRKRQRAPNLTRRQGRRTAENVAPTLVAKPLLFAVEFHVDPAHRVRADPRHPRNLRQSLGRPTDVRGHVHGRRAQLPLRGSQEGGVVTRVARDGAGELGRGESEAEGVAEAEGEGREVVAGGVFADDAGEVGGVGFVAALGLVAALEAEELLEFRHDGE